MSSTRHARGPLGARASRNAADIVAKWFAATVIVVQVDGSMRNRQARGHSRRCLGAEEYGFPPPRWWLEGCHHDAAFGHLDTCPVGVATQNPELRKRFSGTPELVVRFFRVHSRGQLGNGWRRLGFRTVAEAIGRSDVLEELAADEAARLATLGPFRYFVPAPTRGARSAATHQQDHPARSHIGCEADRGVPPSARRRPTSVGFRGPSSIPTAPSGTMLGSEVTRRYGGAGLPEGTIELEMTGSAGQSFGAFVPSGITLRALRGCKRLSRKGSIWGADNLAAPVGRAHGLCRGGQT